jgi:hypothetical protein
VAVSFVFLLFFVSCCPFCFLSWRKALRAAVSDNPLIKGEGLSPKPRRELLGHS